MNSDNTIRPGLSNDDTEKTIRPGLSNDDTEKTIRPGQSNDDTGKTIRPGLSNYDTGNTIRTGASTVLPDEIMAELDELVGIDEIKEKIKQMIYFMDIERERKGSNAKREMNDHFLFLGNPGTGKATIARIMANIFYSLGVLPTNKLVMVDRSSLVSSFIGQTATQTRDAVNRAMGGILFVDEAYMLNRQSDSGYFDYGQEAIDTLLPCLLDYRGKFVCILAGSSKKMAGFIEANSGIVSRFNKTVNFRDYTTSELTEIFRRIVKKEKMMLDYNAETHIEKYFHKMYAGRGVQSLFGNAREVREVFDCAMKNQALRLKLLRGTSGYTPSMINILTRADIEKIFPAKSSLNSDNTLRPEQSTDTSESTLRYVPDEPAYTSESTLRYIPDEPAYTSESTLRYIPDEPAYLISRNPDACLVLKDGAIIGRCTGNYVQVFGTQSYISGAHARVQKNAAGTWEVVDLSSTNGTFLNNQKLAPNQPAAFKVGDTISFYDLHFIVADECHDFRPSAITV